MRDGRNTVCRQCCSVIAREYRKNNPEAFLPKPRAYKPKKPIQYGTGVSKRRKKRTREQREQQIARYYAKYPEKLRAHKAVANAVYRGRLVRPDTCSKCGGGGWIQASHDDYSKRLQIEWLCVSCHRIKDGQAGQ